MHVLLTGGAGYIGSHTAVMLLAHGYEVTIADNLSNCNPVVVDRIKKITKKDVRFYQMDVCDRAALDQLFAHEQIDAVIHFAALKAIGESVANPLMYYRNNMVSTLALLESMQAAGIHHLIFSSSATVYAAGGQLPLTEDQPQGCTNPYGWTKVMTEQMMLDVAQAYPDWSIAILRYFNPIGAHESGEIGEDPHDIPSNLLPYLTQVAAGKLPRLQVYGNDYETKDGTGVRDYIHVTDVASGHVSALAYVFQNTGVEAFNLGTGIGYSVLDVIATFETATGITIPYEICPRRAGDAASCYASVEKAHRVLGWHAEKTLQQMCLDAWHWQKNNPNGYSASPICPQTD